jgi:hypothetical protein
LCALVGARRVFIRSSDKGLGFHLTNEQGSLIFFFLSSFSSCAHNFACAASPLAQLGESALGRQRSVASHTHDRAKKNQKKRGKKEKGETRQARKGGPQSRPFSHITKQQTTRRMEREWRCFHGDSSFFFLFPCLCVCFRENWEARSM